SIGKHSCHGTTFSQGCQLSAAFVRRKALNELSQMAQRLSHCYGTKTLQFALKCQENFRNLLTQRIHPHCYVILATTSQTSLGNQHLKNRVFVIGRWVVSS